MNPRAAAATAVIAAAALVSCTDDSPTARRQMFLRPGGVEACPPIQGYSFPVADHGSADVAAAAPIIEIDAGDNFFTPTCGINVPAGVVTLRVTNIGRMKHNVSIRKQGSDVDVLPGETIDVDVQVESGGPPLVYFCKYHRTSGMVGALITEA